MDASVSHRDLRVGLTNDALSALSTSLPENKERSIQAFVSSQEQFATAYMKEGHRMYSQWLKEMNSVKNGVHEEHVPDKAIELGGGFSSPVLKPRRSEPHETLISSSHTGYNALDTHNPVRNRLKLNVDEASMEKAHVKATPEPNLTHNRKSNATKRMNRITECHQEDKPIPCSQKENTKRNCTDDDAEYEERLAQRRERKNRRKSIVTSKTYPEKLCLKSASANQPKSKSKTKESGRGSSSKSKLSTSLALMHGIKACNLGNQRLTFKPFDGVFNKGRSSDRMAASKFLTTGNFNESNFLDKVLTTSLKGRNKEIKATPPGSPSISSQTSVQEKPNETRLDPNRLTLPSTPVSQSKHSGPKPPPLLEGQIQDIDGQSDYASQIWDIEREFLEKSSESPKKDMLSEVKSVVMDSKAWEWHHPDISVDVEVQDSLVSTKDNLQEPAQECDVRSITNGSLTSLAPSQSASQLPVHTVPPLRKSKFFDALPSRRIEDISEPRCQDVSQAPSLAIETKDIDTTKKMGNYEESVQEASICMVNTTTERTDVYSLGINSISGSYDNVSSSPYDAFATGNLEILTEYAVGSELALPRYLSYRLQSSLGYAIPEFDDESLNNDPEPPNIDFKDSRFPEIDTEDAPTYPTYTAPESWIPEAYSDPMADIHDGIVGGFKDVNNEMHTLYGIGLVDPNLVDAVQDIFPDTASLNGQEPAGVSNSMILGAYATDCNLSQNNDEGIDHMTTSGFSEEYGLKFEGTRNGIEENTFLQGRALLLGIEDVTRAGQQVFITETARPCLGTLEDAESIVAKSMHDHWYPMKH